MADEKLNTGPGEEKLPEAPAPVTVDEPQAPAPEQTAAPTPQQEGPAQPEPGDVVVSFDKINELMNEKRQTARATMNELLDGAKLPKMADMKKARQELAGKKKALYAEYRKAQADMRQAVAIKANIDHLLGVTDGRENKAQER